MIPGQFDYVRPGDLDETLRILKDREGEAKLLSGGYSLLPLIKLRLAQPGLLVDLRDVSGLDGITETDDYLRIGARATHRQIHEAADHPRHVPAAPRRDRHDRRPAGPQLGHDRRLRRPRRPGVGLAGGPHRGATPRSSAAARPASATIAARDFFLDTFQTAIEPTEVLTEIRIAPAPARPGRRLREARAQGRRLRDRRRRGDRQARRRRPDRGRRDRPDRRRRDAVRGDRRRGRPRRQRPVGRPLPRRPAPPPEPRAGPAGDVRGPVEYKRAMAAELTLRALRRATERALAYA